MGRPAIAAVVIAGPSGRPSDPTRTSGSSALAAIPDVVAALVPLPKLWVDVRTVREIVPGAAASVAHPARLAAGVGRLLLIPELPLDGRPELEVRAALAPTRPLTDVRASLLAVGTGRRRRRLVGARRLAVVDAAAGRLESKTRELLDVMKEALITLPRAAPLLAARPLLQAKAVAGSVSKA